MKMYELYVKLISLSAGCASSMLMLTPLLVCRDIIQKKSSDHVKVGTFTGAFFRSSLFFRQGQLLNLQTVMYVHGMGLILNFLYISLYYFYSSKKNEVIKNVFNIISISFILILYSVFESKEVVSIRYPSIVSVIHILIIAWPLLSLRETFRTKCWLGHPKPIIINGTIVSVLWFLYSINVKNKIMFIQCFISTILCSAQLVLISIYPTDVPKKSEKEE